MKKRASAILVMTVALVSFATNAIETPLPHGVESAMIISEMHETTIETHRTCKDINTAWTESVGDLLTNYVYSEKGEPVLLIMSKLKRNKLTLLSQTTPHAWIMRSDSYDGATLNGANIDAIITQVIGADAADCFATLWNPLN